MPLRDHFRSPLDDKFSWDMLHGMWPGVMTKHLNEVLPENYFAGPGVHLGSVFEVDIAAFQEPDDEPEDESGDGGVALAAAPPKATFTLEPRLPGQDVYEVRVYDGRRERRLVAAIEIVSPTNKDRLEHRESFEAKVIQLLKSNICVSIVDVVTTLDHNLCGETLELIESAHASVGTENIYATTLRTRYEGSRKLLDAWYHPLNLGQLLPSLPIWLNSRQSVMLDLEATYEECCRSLRIR